MPTELSPEFQRWHHSFFVDRGPRGEDVDDHALQQLRGGEREEAFCLLIDALPRGDKEVPRALGSLRDARAIDSLKAHVASATGEDFVATVHALWSLERWPEAPHLLAAALQGQHSEEEDPELSEFDLGKAARIDAVLALQEIGGSKAVAVLLGAIEDRSDLVRYHATRALGQLCGPFPVFDELATQIMSEEPAQRVAARAEILRRVRAAPSVEDDGASFRVNFNPLCRQFVDYSEKDRDLHFWLKLEGGIHLLCSGNALTGVFGKPIPLSIEERGRVIPRVEQFLSRNRICFRTSPGSHPPWPEDETFTIDDTLVILDTEAGEPNGSSRGFPWRTLWGAAFGGFLGTLVWGLASLWTRIELDHPWSGAWIIVACALMGWFLWLRASGDG